MFLLSFFMAIFYFIISAIIDRFWFAEISHIFGDIFAYYMIIFVALVPGFIFMFVVVSLIINQKKNTLDLKCYPDITILIPTFNSGLTILKTIKSILNQRYPGKIFIKVIDDGSNDKTLKFLKVSYVHSFIELINAPHVGKFNALNIGLKGTNTKYVISIDSDTYLLKNALKEIIKEINNSEYVAVAGSLLVKNNKDTFITKIQEWDYTIGIFGIKTLQSYYKSTLVAQGAFSIYKTSVLKELGGWTNHLGEDIILTWRMLEKGYKVGFSGTALALTDVPETYQKLGIQRKRWARGMIEAFKELKHFFFSKANIKSKFLVFLNLFFPFIDIALLIFLPVGLFLLVTGNHLLMGILTLLMLPFGLILTITIEIKMRNNLRKIGYKQEKRSKLAFLAYILFYNFLLAPYCLSGYISEIFNLNKTWSGTKKKKGRELMYKRILYSFVGILLLAIIGFTVNEVVKSKENENLKIPILLYHDITTAIPKSDPYNYEYVTTIDNLEENIKAILENGYKIVTISDLNKLNPLPYKPIIITFDDGLISNYDLVFPLLKKYNIKVGMSITSDLVGTYDEVENRKYFSWKQAKEMADSGLVEFYSHGKRHVFYNNLSLTEFETEIIESIDLIEQNLNIDINTFVYPYGAYNECMVSTLRDNVNVQIYDLGVNNYESIDYSFIRRINISYYMSGKDIINYINNN